jgi:hypothetical protein
VSTPALAPQFLIPRQLDGADLPAKPTDRFYPLVQPDGTIRFASNEAALWRGKANVGEYLYTEQFDDYDRLWELPEPADVLITNRRIVFMCERWSVGGGWRSHGTAPVTTALLNAASKMRAAAQRRGVVMVGHCRWEWPVFIHVQPGTPAIQKQRAREPSILLAAKAGLQKGHYTLRFSGPGLATAAAAEAAGNAIMRAVTSHRLSHASVLGLDERELERLSELNKDRPFTVAESRSSQQFNLPGLLFIGFMARAEYEYASADIQRILDKRED